jgi:gliding motility-associated-like protein
MIITNTLKYLSSIAMMRSWQYIMLFVLLSLAELCIGQNLVKNPSFEDYTSCPYTYYARVHDATGWSEFRESPDYANSCAGSIPYTPGGNYQIPLTGNAYCAFIAYGVYQNGNYREHICGTLCQTLTIGQKYFVSINVTLGENSDGPCNKIGVRLSTVASADPSIFGPLPNSAHVYTNSMISDSVNWVKIKGSFIADSAYNYIVIGNFFDEANTTKSGTGAMYLLDDVCVSPDSLTCYASEPDRFLGNDTALCEGQTLVLNATTQNSTYIWQDHTFSPTYTVSNPGVYWVKVESNNCGYKVDSIHVIYNKPPIINLGNDTIICKHDTILIDVTNGNSTYLWQNNSTISHYLIEAEGLYWVKVSKDNCLATDTILVKTKACEVFFEVPNVFTPNGDGSNEKFHIKNSILLNDLRITIYNRWGQKTFESNDPDPEWNGKDNSIDCPPGTYFWIITYSDFENKQVTLNGFLTLIK